MQFADAATAMLLKNMEAASAALHDDTNSRIRAHLCFASAHGTAFSHLVFIQAISLSFSVGMRYGSLCESLDPYADPRTLQPCVQMSA
jgi:hypothetical protein